MTTVDEGAPTARPSDEQRALRGVAGEGRGDGAKGPMACPALGISDDPGTHFMAASRNHRCFAAAMVRSIPSEHQEAFCLTTEYERCPIWQLSAAPFQPAQDSMPVAAGRSLHLPLPHLRRRSSSLKGLRRPNWHVRIPSLRRSRLHRRLLRRVRAVGNRKLAATGAALLGLLLIAGVTVALTVRSSSGAGTHGTASPRASVVSKPSVTSTAALASTTAAANRPPPPKAADLADDQVLRPGAILVKRLNVTLDGSRSGNVVVSSRVASPGGCDRWFLDIYAYDEIASRFIDVFDSTAGIGDASPLLPQPAMSDLGCVPNVNLLETGTFASMSSPLVVAGIVKPDGHQRLVAVTLPPSSRKGQIVYDASFGTSGTTVLLDSPSRLEITERAFAPAIAGIADSSLGPVGQFTQVLGGKDGSFGILSRSFVPACTAGTVAAIQTIDGERWLRIGCAAGNHGNGAVFVLAPGAGITPSGATFEGLQVGDEVTVVASGAVRPPGNAASAVAVASGLRLTGSAAARYPSTPGPTPSSVPSSTPSPTPAPATSTPAAPRAPVATPPPAAPRPPTTNPVPVAPPPRVTAPAPPVAAPPAVAPAAPLPLPVATALPTPRPTEPPPPFGGGLAPPPSSGSPTPAAEPPSSSGGSPAPATETPPPSGGLVPPPPAP